MPGAPPVSVVSVTDICWTPLTRNEIVLPTAVSFSCVPAASGPVVAALSCCQPPAFRTNSISAGLPEFQK